MIISNQAVFSRLQSFGWGSVLVCNPVVIASKIYTSAVGPKTATAYLYSFDSDSPEVVLSGEYTSEGRNILSTSNVLIPKDVDMETLCGLVDQFARDVDLFVSESYAVRLLRH